MKPSDVEQAQVAGLPRHVVGVAAAVVDESGRVLVVQRREPRRWELPGGALELDEPLLAGLRREVREETGLDVEPVRLSGVYQNVALGPIALVFLCRRLGGRERLSEETVGWRWLRRDEVPTLLAPARAARALDALDALDVLDALGGAAQAPTAVPVRLHDGTQLLG